MAILPFKGVVFEADAQRDPSPMDVLRDLSQKVNRSTKLVLYKDDLNSDLASLYSVVFDVVLDSRWEKKMGVEPKPSPAAMTRCLADLGLEPELCVAFVTTLEGAAACHAANVGLLVASAPDSLPNEDGFRAAGVDVVLPFESPLSLERLSWMYNNRVNDLGWQLRYNIYNPVNERLRETLTAVGNGYMGVRGSSEQARLGAQQQDSYAGCYIAGVYNCSTSTVHGLEIQNSDLVNCPDWTSVRLSIDNSEWINITQQKILEYTHCVDLKRAQTERSVTFEDAHRRRTRIQSVRIVSMASPHQAGLTYTVTALNYSAPIVIRSFIDGDVQNKGVERYRELNSRHLKVIRTGELTHGAFYVVTMTTGLRSTVEIAMTARHALLVGGKEVFGDPKAVGVQRKYESLRTEAAEIFEIHARAGISYTIEKIVSTYTSRDPDLMKLGIDPLDATVDLSKQQISFAQLCSSHRQQWDLIWRRMDVQLQGDRSTRLLQKMARLHLYHLLSSCSPNNLELDSGLLVRGLTGENHRGHVFWDEAFCFPTLLASHPSVAKAHLLYRTNRLDAARRHAQDHGHSGAMIPWQTSDTGLEDTQIVKYNPLSQKWDPDMSRRQRHGGLAVFLDAWRYLEATHDHDFLAGKLGELMLEIARFFGGLAKVGNDGKFHISGVMGPDEYHEDVGTLGGGVTDNAYTNIMTAWMLSKAVEIARGHVLHSTARDALLKKLKISSSEVEHWDKVTRKLAVHIRDDGVLEQFKGFFSLRPLDWSYYKARYENLQRLDRILRAEGKRPDDFQIVKQPDVLMTFYFLHPEELEEVLQKLGIKTDPLQLLERNYDFYAPLTTAGSALTFTVHAKLAELLHRPAARGEWLMESVRGDVFGQRSADGSPSEGVHLGVMAGTLDLMMARSLGIRQVSDRVYDLEPGLLPKCNKCSFAKLIRGMWFHFTVTSQDVEIHFTGAEDWAFAPEEPVTFRIGEVQARVGRGSPATIQYALTDLKDFINIMKRTRVIRQDVARRVFTGRPLLRQQLLALKTSRDVVLSFPSADAIGAPGKRILKVDGQPCYIADLTPEVRGIEKDLHFLGHGEDALVGMLAKEHAGFKKTVKKAGDWLLAILKEANADRFQNLITSRDGVIVERTPRYLTSIQPAWNSVFLTRFATGCCTNSTILTRSPLGGEASDRGEPIEANGLWDVSVNPPGTFVYAGSNGRSFLTTQDVRGNFPFDEKADKTHQAFSRKLGDLLRTPAFEKHKTFGHGYQTRWALSVVPKGDESIRLPRPEVHRLHEEIKKISNTADPSGRLLRITERHSDFEISVRPPGTREGEWNKGKGLRFLDERLGLGVKSGPNLVCVVDEADVAMIEHCFAECPRQTWCIVVSKDTPFTERIKAKFGNRILVLPHPDYVLGAMNAAAREKGAVDEVKCPGSSPKL